MDYQILALDLDGTLTNSSKEISEPTKRALIDIQKAGKKVVLASGRPTMGVMPLARQLHLEEYGSYILSYNGGCITDCKSGEILYDKKLPPDIVAPIHHIIRKYAGVDILFYTEQYILSGGAINPYSELEARINQVPLVKARDFVSQASEPGNKFLVTGEPDILLQIKREASDYFRSYLGIYNSDPYFLEIMPPGIDKAHSLLRLLTAIGLSADQMICCGDGENDLGMIETAGLGVAMANAQPAVRARADYITRSNDEDGVLHVINEFLR